MDKKKLSNMPHFKNFWISLFSKKQKNQSFIKMMTWKIWIFSDLYYVIDIF